MSYFDPKRMPEMSARRREAARLQLEHVVERTPAAARRRRRVVIAVAIATVLLATGAAIATVVLNAPVRENGLARCFTVANTSGFNIRIAEPGKPGSRGQVRNAKYICAGLYQEGFLRLGAHRII